MTFVSRTRPNGNIDTVYTHNGIKYAVKGNRNDENLVGVKIDPMGKHTTAPDTIMIPAYILRGD